MQGKKVRLEYKLKQGDVSKYKTIVEAITEIIEGGETKNVSSIMEMATTQTVSGIFPDGSMKVDVFIDSASLRKNGEELPVPNTGQTMPMKLKSNGEIFQMSEVTSGGRTHASLPDNHVGTGDSWSGESPIEIPGTDKTVILKTAHTLESFEKINGYECAKIYVSTPEIGIPIQDNISQTVVVTGTIYFDYNEGRLIKSVSETKTWMDLLAERSVRTLTKMIIEIKSSKKSGEYSFNNNFMIPSI